MAACTTDKKDSADNRLKGIRIYAAQVNADGTVKALNTFEDNKHNHCEKWHAPVYCPAGHLVTGLKLYHKDDAFTVLASNAARCSARIRRLSLDAGSVARLFHRRRGSVNQGAVAVGVWERHAVLRVSKTLNYVTDIVVRIG